MHLALYYQEDLQTIFLSRSATSILACIKTKSIPRLIHPILRQSRYEIYHLITLFNQWEAGMEEYQVDECRIKIYSLAKTLADCFKFRNKIGANIGREALKRTLIEKKTDPKEIMRYAKICRVDRIIKPVLEAMLLFSNSAFE